MIVQDDKIIKGIFFKAKERSFTLRNKNTLNSFSFVIKQKGLKREVFLIIKRTSENKNIKIGYINNNYFKKEYVATFLPDNQYIVWAIESLEWYFNYFNKYGLHKIIEFRINNKCKKCGSELKNSVSLINGLGKDCLNRFNFINKYKNR